MGKIYGSVAVCLAEERAREFEADANFSGICNTIGRAATIVSPFIVLALFRNYGVAGVLALMIALLMMRSRPGNCGGSANAVASVTRPRIPLQDMTFEASELAHSRGLGIWGGAPP